MTCLNLYTIFSDYVSANFSSCEQFYIGLYQDAYGGYEWPITESTYDDSSYTNWKTGKKDFLVNHGCYFSHI